MPSQVHLRQRRKERKSKILVGGGKRSLISGEGLESIPRGMLLRPSNAGEAMPGAVGVELENGEWYLHVPGMFSSHSTKTH